MLIRNYGDIIHRMLVAIKKSKNLNVWYQAATSNHSKSLTNTSYPLYCLHYTSQQYNTPTIYVSAGIHGDEPAGVECAVRLIEQLADTGGHSPSAFPLYEYNWLISPCDNPYGYEQNIRENEGGFDLNRMFDKPLLCSETAFISETLTRMKYRNINGTYTKGILGIELALDLHEDCDSKGFYLWERRTSQCSPIGNAVINTVVSLCPINRKPSIEDHSNENGVITLLDKVTTKGWTRGRYLAEKVNTRCLILETPTYLDFEKRVRVHWLAIQAAIKQVCLDINKTKTI